MRHLKLILILLFGINLTTYSQTDKLIPKAQTIKTAYDDLLKNPGNMDLQKRYVMVFPDNADVFKQVFDSPTFDQLYADSHLFIFELFELSKSYPDLVGEKLITLSIGLKKYEADAISFIQHETMRYSYSYYSDFIRLIKKLSKKDLNTLATFLADVEAHDAYIEYKVFLDLLESNKENGLLKLFKHVKNKRISKKNH